MSFWADILTHTSFFSAFLTGFYFLFVTNVQQDSIVNDFFGMLKPNIMSNSAVSKPYEISEMISDVQNTKNQINSNSDLDTANQHFNSKNPLILQNISIIIGVLAPILLLAGIGLQYYNGDSITELLLSNVIVIIFIAASEFFIVGVFMRNFIEIDSSFVSAIPVVSNRTNSRYNCNYVKEFANSEFPPSISSLFN